MSQQSHRFPYYTSINHAPAFESAPMFPHRVGATRNLPETGLSPRRFASHRFEQQRVYESPLPAPQNIPNHEFQRQPSGNFCNNFNFYGTINAVHINNGEPTHHHIPTAQGKSVGLNNNSQAGATVPPPDGNEASAPSPAVAPFEQGQVRRKQLELMSDSKYYF
ncbi:hypothetical protein Ocin01_15394 [Orchesella cincta]|uniref:Uncharacterized protein n=1 Tax=Orchesella cincta TaxID=48709 RepID=A0A1D2ME37_ORCCI|nr:hypothetical protein Ocin01_15394 [Orchesella cincta]